jgi:preprotein translocase subunit SecA
MLLDTILKKIFGSRNDRELKRIGPMVAAISDLEPGIQKLTDDQLRAKTAEFREKLSQGAALDDILFEAFAVCRETGRRQLNMRHFDVQLIGGIALHEGKIAEMKTGEGKTLVATLPVYLNALSGRGVHVVTVNDYLAKRDSEWMGKIYNFLGLSVGVIQHDLDDAERRVSYYSDVTYGTNNEFGFDYLRDNMKFDIRDCVHRMLPIDEQGTHKKSGNRILYNYAIVDEVDSILIDEARTPLIISGASEESTDKYYKINAIVPHLKAEKHYLIDEKLKTATLNEEGVSECERLLNIENMYDPSHMDLIHHVYQALKAHTLFKRDVDYVVKDGEEGPEVIIVDEFTGRLMPGRRWSDGLHQAVEAKEGVKVERENQTLATITFQNYFRMYNKLAGMTGTAETEAPEFINIYNLEVLTIPTNRTLYRIEYPDVVYRTEREKFSAVVNEITELNMKGQPILVGTISVEKSERLASMLKKRGVKHVVLNAKYHEKEAEIVAQAGRKGAVTVATNMAGRGTDILLGGNPEFLTRAELRRMNIDPGTCEKEQWDQVFARVKASTDLEHDDVVSVGGLHILGTERHEARRIDNQLRGRAGRQGDPGSSRFYLSLEDDLLRIFGGDRIKNIMGKLGMEEGVPIESRMISKRIEAAQKTVEAHNFDARKHLLEYDDVMNKQREAIYAMRRQLLEGKDEKEYVLSLMDEVTQAIVVTNCPAKEHPDTWNIKGLKIEIQGQFGVELQQLGIDVDQLNHNELIDELIKKLEEKYNEKEKQIGEQAMRFHERVIMLNVVDQQWKDHLLEMDYLREGIGLRGYGQRDPLVEYKRESFDMFQAMMERISEETLRFLYLMQPVTEEQQQREVERKRRKIEKELTFSSGEEATEKPKPVLRGEKIGRNDPCPCGSGKKYKKCHGAVA